MIKLFDADVDQNTDLNTNGLGILTDATSCIVKEVCNGEFELEMYYPVTGLHYSDISLRRCILCKPNPHGTPQLFRIYSITYPINGIVIVNAHHISYDMTGYPLTAFGTRTTISGAVEAIRTACPIVHPFTIEVSGGDNFPTGELAVDTPRSMRSVIGGEENSILTTFGYTGIGEIEFNNFYCTIKDSRAVLPDNSVVISYGKNLTDIKQEKNIADMYTGIYPYAIDDDQNLIQLTSESGYDDHILYADGDFGFDKILPVDLSQYYNSYGYEETRGGSDYAIVKIGSDRQLELISQEEYEALYGDAEFDEDNDSNLRLMPAPEYRLLEIAELYLEANRIGVPKISLDVSFVELSRTDEYSDYAMLESVHIGDIVKVEFPLLGISESAKCVGTEYDALVDRYTTVSLGDVITGIADTMYSQASAVKNVASSTSIRNAISRATKLITGNLGGFVRINDSDGDGEPDEILIMDTADIATATKVWRWNKNGLGYSGDGYNGNYGLAMTADGEIVADYITAGAISTNVIRASGCKEIVFIGSEYPDGTFYPGDVWLVGDTDVTYDEETFLADHAYEWDGEQWNLIADTNQLSTAAALSVLKDSISLFVSNNFYGKQSGIEITADGILITGDSFIMLQSGSYIGGAASNFRLDENGNMQLYGNLYAQNVYADNLSAGLDGMGGYLNSTDTGFQPNTPIVGVFG